MCGIAGIALADPRRSPDEALLRRMASTLTHRGPDDDGFWIRGSLGLAFRRLSIIDLAGGHQPLENETGDVAVVGNGEIYGFRALRERLQRDGHVLRTGSDMETLVHLYEDRGAELVHELVGMFAFAIADARDPERPRLLLGRDRLGIKPLYLAELDGGVAFASEPKALLALDLLPRRLRATKLLDYLVQGYTTGPEAAWEGMRRLPPAHTVEWTRAGLAEPRRYWDLPTDGLRGPAAGEEVLEWIDRAVADRLVADVPLGAFLSGGIDSTAVVDSMARASSDPVIACSVGFREKSHDELDRARATAQRVGAVHHTQVLEPDPTLAVEVLPWLYDEPLADPSTVPTYLVSRMAREHVTVALSGDGGDETFAGYRRYVFDVLENRVRRVAGRWGTRALGLLGDVYPKLDWAPRPLRARSVLRDIGMEPARAYFESFAQVPRDEALAVLAPPLRDALRDHDPFDAFEELYRRPSVDCPLYRAQYADFHGFLPDQILVKTDRASMGVSLEVRVPLLDHRLVGRFANLPAREKVRGGRGKHALREALRARIPADVLDGPKKGFDTPLRPWIRGPLAEAVRDAVETIPADWLDRRALGARLAEHRSGRRDHAHLLWSVLVLEHWRRCHEVRGWSA